MAFPLRWFRSERIYFCTSRTINRRLFLRQSKKVNAVIGAALAQAQARYGVEIFDFVHACPEEGGGAAHRPT